MSTGDPWLDGINAAYPNLPPLTEWPDRRPTHVDGDDWCETRRDDHNADRAIAAEHRDDRRW